MMKTSIFFITFSILISYYAQDVVCPFVKTVPTNLGNGDVVTIKGDANSKQYIMITENTQMPVKKEIVEYLSLDDSDYLENVRQLIKDKLLEESTLDYAKNRLLVLSDDDFHTKKASDNLDNVKQFVEGKSKQAFAEGRHAAAKSPKETSVRTSKEWEIFE